LIEPTVNEQVRWFQLWTSPQAAHWAGPQHQQAVATLVRLEVRCGQPFPTDDYLTELDRVRRELGLSEV
jgi:hypothetical protein